MVWHEKMKTTTVKILLMFVLAVSSTAADGDEIPDVLVKNDVYTYIEKSARESRFLEAYNPAAKAGILALVESEGDGMKPFCHYYRKIRVLPKMDCEYIVYTRDDADHVAIMAFNSTDSGRNCLLIQMKSMTEFSDNDMLSYLKFFGKIETSHPFYQTQKIYYGIFSELIRVVDLENLMILSEFDEDGSVEGDMAHFRKSIAEFLLQFKGTNDCFYLNPQISSLGCFQLSERYFCSVILVHSDLFGYGVVTSLFKKQNEKTVLLRINFKSKAESLIENAPFSIDQD
jgi:hypothetical protein